VLDFCLALEVGDTLISRMDDRVVEVAQVDRLRGLFTLRRADRVTTIPARELVREYERIDPKDFRVLRQLHPERIGELIESDPVALVIGLINAYGQHIDADQLRYELVPRYIEPKSWSKWWTRAKAELKRSPNIIMEGRSPIVLRYSPEGVSLEQEVWEQFTAVSDPEKWLDIAESYLREQKSRKAAPDKDLLHRFREHLRKYAADIRTRRPSEAFACALVAAEIARAEGEPANGLAGEMLAASPQPARWIAELKHDVLWERAFAALPQARPADWPEVVVALLPLSPPPGSIAWPRLADGRSVGRIAAPDRRCAGRSGQLPRADLLAVERPQEPGRVDFARGHGPVRDYSRHGGRARHDPHARPASWPQFPQPREIRLRTARLREGGRLPAPDQHGRRRSA
jgi:hypothetical protein